jgi:hypothetical protein
MMEENVRPRILYALLLAAFASAVPAQLPVPNGATVVETSPGRGVATSTTVASARIVAMDLASRRLDVQLTDGSVVGLVAGPEVRRLAELHPGDVVNVAYVESLVLQLRKNGGPEVARTENADMKRASASAPPGAIAQSQVAVVADVLAVDEASGTVTLRGPQRVVSLRIKDPAQLALVKAGDQVEATYTEAVAVTIDPAR